MPSAIRSSDTKHLSRGLTGRSLVLLALLSVPTWVGCTEDSGGDDDSTGVGGATTGGATTGGATTGGSATGGVATGGATTGGVATGGAATGGAATGGVATGGVATGGAATGGAATGGAATGGVATGGVATGGAETGGTPAGGAETGGTPAGGAETGGTPAGGAESGGSGGGTQTPGSPGCGSSNPLQTGNFTVDIDGTQRRYMLDVPSDYDSNHPYRLIFVWHPLGGSGSQVVSGGFNGLKPLSNNSTIFLTADGLQGSNNEASGPGWWNVNGGDMKLLTAMLENVSNNLCIDQDRIFSTGFSFGGMMSYTVGFEFDLFRAIAPCSGDLQVIPHDENNTAPLPIMAFHGDNDTFVTTARGRAARDQYLERNHCGTQTQPVDPSPCVEYQGCDVTTIWCEFPGGHEPWSQEPQAIWDFFSQF